MATNLSQPAPLDLSGNVAENWKRFKQRFELYNVASGTSTKDEKLQTSLLLHVIGDTALDIYNTFTFDRGDELKLGKVLQKFEEYCTPKKNVTYERHRFFTRSQNEGETIDQYVTELRSRAKSCAFGDLTESLIRDRIICGIPSNALRERLLRQDDLSLHDALKLCRAAEATKTQAKELGTGSSSSATVDAVKKQWKQNPQKQWKENPQKQSQNKFNKPCNRCGYMFHSNRKCPAMNQKCQKCGKMNHFSKCCRTGKSAGAAKVDELEQSEQMADDNFFVDAINEESTSDEWKLVLQIQSKPVEFKLDTGAQTNLLPEEVYKQLNPKPKLQKAKVKLTGYTGVDIPVKGRCVLTVVYKGKYHVIPFVVTPGNHKPLLGLQACNELNLVKRVLNINREPEKFSPDEFDDRFEGLGCLPGKHHITLKPDAHTVQHACRKVPFPIRNQLKEELDRMEAMNVITKVDEPTEWVSSLVIVEKKNGKLRICLDPRDLNRAIMREHYKLPSREEIASQFTGAKIFSKLDASSGFWQVQLDDASSRLCTFITPFGRYRFLRLPFGISSAPEVYHKIVHDLFEGLPGVNTMMDDIIVWGTTQEEHDKRLRQVMEIARRANLTLNREKCQFSVNRLTFVGDVLCEDGIQPDPAKIAAIMNMKRPENKTEVQRFLGMVNYLGKFLPHLSTKSAPLRNLLDERNEWSWQESQENAWIELKEILTSEPLLQFYDPEKPIRISADASKDGLGAVLLQQKDDKWLPVVYASRAMTEAEQRYAQIEKELLAITFACERFHQHIYGQELEVETDHKPLIPLFTKSLSDCPLRIQRLMIRLQRYDLKVSYTPGKFMYVADALSRAVDRTTNVETQKDDVQSYVDMVLTSLPVSSNKKEEIIKETASDTTLQKLLTVIRNGWPNAKHQCDPAISMYWNVRHELSEAGGMIFKGQKIVMPSSLRKEMLRKVHEGHLGIEKCKRRAREVMYWPNINNDITIVVQNCRSCLEYKPRQQQERLTPHSTPARAWEKVAADLFTVEGKNYIVMVDYFSQYIEVCNLNTSTSSNAVIDRMKSVFARHGTPCEVFTDNGPQFSSAEFRRFAEEWDFIHTTSSPHYPQSNGLAESAVKIVKNIMHKTKHSGQDLYKALQIYRSSPLECGKSPAELLFSRRLRSNLPIADSLLRPQQMQTISVRKREEQQKRYDQHARNLPKLAVGDHVKLLDMNSRRWSREGVVTAKLPYRSYLVESEDVSVRRNRKHLRQIKTQQPCVQPMNHFEPDAPKMAENPPDECNQQHAPTGDDVSPTPSPAKNLPSPENNQSRTSTRMTRSGRIINPPKRLDL